MNNKYYKSPEPSWLMRQFWKACGADEYLLRRSTYSDQIKYFCLGGIVVATGAMAAMAGGYAFYTIFEPKGGALENMVTKEALKAGASTRDFIHFPTVLLSAVFGLIWGMIIYNIDRFIVTSTGKGDGTEAITGQEIRSAIPRIIMGLIIALTISKPIEIRMFKTEIDIKLHEKQIEQQKIYEVDTRETFKKTQDDIEKQINVYEAKIDEKKKRYAELEQNYTEEVRIITVGPRAKALKAEMKKLDEEIKKDEKNPLYLDLIKNRIDTEKQLQAKLKESTKVAQGLDGLLERIKLAHEAAGFWISLFITLLFMVIELTPIFFKMMLIKGPYDYMDDNIRDLARAESGIEIMYNYYEDKKGMEAHKVVNHGAELKQKERLLIIKAQEELNEQIIASWKQRKSKDIQENPGKYINEEE